MTKSQFEDTLKRFESYGWETFEMNGHDYAEINDTFKEAKENLAKEALRKAGAKLPIKTKIISRE